MKNNPEIELLAEMSANGFHVTQIEYDKWVRYTRAGAKTNKKNCYYRATRTCLNGGDELVICCYGDWSSDEQYIFRSTLANENSQSKKVKEVLQDVKNNLDAEIEKMQLAAKETALEKWNNATYQGVSCYLKKKYVDGLFGAKVFGSETLVPIMDCESNLVGIQTIMPTGDKFFLKGQKVKGCFHVIGGFDQLSDAPIVYLVEGFATGCAIRMATHAPVICAFSANNLSPVCENIKKLFPFLKLVVCADNDQFTDGNPGKTKAINAATRFNRKIIWPEFKDISTKPTDFHDLYIIEGLDAVKSRLNDAGFIATDAPPPIQLAEEFLTHQNFRKGNDLFLRCWQEQFFRFTGKKYQPISKGDLFADTMRFIQNHNGARVKAGTALANNVIANLQGLTNVSSSDKMPSWIERPDLDIKNYISLDNGIFNLKKWLCGETNVIAPHSHQFFSTVCVPFAYDPSASCPRWMHFLEDVQPQIEMRDLLQEWMGLNLVYDTDFCKFVLLVGEGANGKTVFCVVLRCLLGAENVSAVNLEGFDPKRTFQMAATIGKLANIVGELNQLDKAAEGELKKFVAGEMITAERKYEHPFEFTPTARLTFATNILPRFVDSTDGLWRRLLLIPFTVQIKDEAKQDKNLVNPDWWIKSGELPGIFNWALDGLKRLYERGHFLEPNASRAAKESFRQDANPTRTFLLDNYEYGADTHFSSNELYEAYSGDLKAGGHTPLPRTLFATEVKRAFPSVELTKNPQREGNKPRSRKWIGLCAKY